jgi:catechol 2,3-dioxygenase-like lactoylglutathione lyase family enzyme
MSDAQKALDLPPCCQVGFVYPDLEDAIALYTPIFGEFRIVDYGETKGARFRGRPSPYHLRLAVAYSGDLEIELIEWVSGETPHKEFIQAGRSGMHHLSFHVPDLDGMVERAKGLGYDPIWYHRMSDEIAYTYLERPGDPLLIELTERPWSGGNVQQ